MVQPRKKILFIMLLLTALLSCRHDVADLLFDQKIVAPVTPKVINVTATNANGTFATGSPIHIQIVFNTSVAVTGSPKLVVSTGNPITTEIDYLSGSGTTTLQFDYTVIATNSSPDLDYASTGALILSGGTIMGTNGVTAELPLPAPGAAGSLGANKDIIIDPTAAKVTNVTASNANGSYIAGANITVQVTFDANVTVTGTPQLPLDVVTTNTYANCAVATNVTVISCTYTVATGNSSGDLNYPSGAAISLSGGTIIKVAGSTAADLTLPAFNGANSLGTNKNIVIDAIVPFITNVTSSTPNGSYKGGDSISIQVTFSKSMAVNTGGGTPSLSLNSGGSATYVSVATNTLTFTYTVGGGQTTSDLNTTGSISLNGGTLADTLGNVANLTLSGTTLATNKDIIIDTTLPTISSITSSTTNGSYKAGAIISIQVIFSENITVAGGPPVLNLNIGGAAATFVNVTGSNTANFTYTILATQNSPDLDATSISLSGATIRDAALNDATITMPGSTLATNKNIIVDTTAPTVTGMNSSKAGQSFATLLSSVSIDIVIMYSEPVNVTGTPTLALANGGTATYSSGSATSSLTFTYTASNTTANPLNYSVAGALSGGTISDLATNAANNALPTGGGSYLSPLNIILTLL